MIPAIDKVYDALNEYAEQQSAQIARLKDENQQLHKQLDILTDNYARLEERQRQDATARDKCLRHILAK